MAFDLYSGSTDFGHDNAVVPIVLPGVPGETSAIARDAHPSLDSSQGRYATGLEKSPRERQGDGFARTVKRLAYRAARQLLRLQMADILALDLGPMRERRPEKSSLKFRFLTAEEIRAAAGDAANDLDANMAGRLDFGRNFCFAALDRGRLANYSWYALGHIEPEHSSDAGLTLPEDTVFMYKAFTLPAYRGQRLHQATIHRAVQIFARMGIRRLVALVEYGNWASLRSHLGMGCRRAGRFCLIGRRPILWRCDANYAGNLELGCPGYS